MERRAQVTDRSSFGKGRRSILERHESDKRHLRGFKHFINEQTTKTYLIELSPYTSEESIRDSIREIVGWCLYHTDQGQGMLITARPFDDTISEGRTT